MPGQICAVASCRSNRFILKKNGVNLIFHSFPKANDLVSSTIRKEWIHRCKRKDKFNPDTSAICCLHFTPNDYERDLQNELLGLPLRRVLKKTAVPTLKLNSNREKPSEKPIADTPRAKRAEKRRKKDMVESLLTKASFSNREASQLLDVPSTSTPVTSYTEESDRLSSSFTEDSYKQKYKDLLLKYNELKTSSSKKIKRLNSMLKYYKMKFQNQSVNKSTKSVMAERLK